MRCCTGKDSKCSRHMAWAASQVASQATNSEGGARTRSSLDALSLDEAVRDSPVAGARRSLGGSLHSAHSAGSDDTEALAELLYSSDPMRGASC
jgi:hypothetical protein